MKQYYKRGLLVAVALVIITALVLSGCSGGGNKAPAASGGTPAASGSSGGGDPIVINWVAFIPQNHPQVIAFENAFCQKINERSNGELVMEFRGGPDTISPMDQGEAARSGAVDMSFVIVGFYESQVPAVTGMMLSQLEPDEEFSDAYDYIQEIHHAGGLHWVMRAATTTGNFFYTWLKQPVSDPSEFKDMLMGSSTGGMPAVKAWGGAWTQVESNDSYTAMEQGVCVAIAGQPIAILESQSMYEVADYAVDHGYFKGTAQVIMNLDKWNSLPPHLQDLLTETAKEATQEIKAIGDADVARIRQDAIDKGFQFITFPPAVAEKYVKDAYDTAWDLLEEKFPQQAPGLRAALTK